MLQRIKALEDRQQDNVENGLSDLAAYGLRREHDFDKYKALSMAEDLIAVARNTKHEKVAFLSAAARALRDRLDKPISQFQGYFLALFSDQDYSKVLDSIAKVDKSLRAAIPSSPVSAASSVRPPTGNARFICHACGIPGHTAPYCFRRRNRPVRGRFATYQRASSARGSFHQ